MEIHQNDAPGQSIILVAGDNLSRVPKSHHNLLSPLICEIFSDPTAHFRKIARSCPFATMAKWLDVILKEGAWTFELHRGHVSEWTSVAFHWHSSAMRGAAISPSLGPPPATLPPVFQTFYSLVDEVSWMDFAYAGGLYGAGTCRELPMSAGDNPDDSAVPTTVNAFGSSLCGDELIYTQDGRAGWRNHESGTVHFLGTIEDAINWVFGELFEDRCPDWNDDW